MATDEEALGRQEEEGEGYAWEYRMGKQCEEQDEDL